MVIRNLDLSRFRNYTRLQTEFATRLNWIHGDNGQGKTNLVEAIHYLFNLESFRTRRNKDLLQTGHPTAELKAEIERKGVFHKTRIEVTSRGRQVYLDHTSFRRVSEYILSFIALTLTPEEVALFRGSPQERRRFFNRIQSILDPSFFRILQEYARTLAQKNALLKQHESQKLDLWNRLLSRHALMIVRQRRRFMQSVSQLVHRLFVEISGRDEHLELHYLPSMAAEEESEEAFTQELESMSQREIQAGHSLLGPHRDDFQLSLDHRPGRNFFSQGEFRITNLALKMSLNQLLFQEYQFHPVLILDDLLSELDSRMKRRIMDYLLNLENQVFITSTSPPGQKIFGKTFQISHGRTV